ncbi:ATP-dependent nuclease [Curtobacterium poinsettiae]|uniref:AAA family ATPase n=1 Tax=Curtobacterium flaccumfaciens pv. flaccumfaciens TaxID=138532 RepID=A0A9Q2W7Y2_9MICO|nr:AAA family ATPase [Curtobacterium flaccumfaciens]MBT1542610.1 AAA family ATPase [Curtobacterium flaccumfaciens pv. flaccumfaciens]
MKLVSANVRRYRSIEDGSTIRIEPDVTCLVGKNESGKSAVLQALYKSYPIERGERLDPGLDFPSRLTGERRSGDPITATELKYELDDQDVEEVERRFGSGVLASKTITVTSGYHYKFASRWTILTNERKAADELTKAIVLPPDEQDAVDKATDIAETVTALENVDDPTGAVADALATVKAWRQGSLTLAIVDVLDKRRPHFVYFGDYDSMPGKVSIPYLIANQKDDDLSRGEQAVISLLDIAGIELKDFLEPESQEHLIRDTENASNGISDEVFQYWSQNKNLAVKLTIFGGYDEDAVVDEDTPPELQIRVENQRHRVTVPFDERSRGFVWFFSFLAYFSQIEAQSDHPLILLLDEPGINLHASAQADLLRFIDDRLAPKHQVIFSTHSPFMINPQKLERVRTVVDVDNEGTQVSDQVLQSDEETSFPLHAALGIELAQTLFVAPNTLLVEGPSDLVYLEVLSNALKSKGREGLDDRWAIAPAGGASKLPAFVTLLGANHLNAVVLADSEANKANALELLRQRGKTAAAGVVFIGDATGGDEADIEDLFDPGFFLQLVNDAYAGALAGATLKVADLPQDKRLIRRVERVFADRGINDGKVNHYAPAAALLRKQGTFTNKLSDRTLNAAEALFRKLNTLVK